MMTPLKSKTGHNPFIFKFLRCLSFLWEKYYFFRRVLYSKGTFQQKKLSIPVISVGNLTFGGTGKTPLTIWLAQFFEQQRVKPLILMRGYKGDFESTGGMIKGDHPFFSSLDPYFGDEPLLIARYLKEGAVVVGKNRVQNLQRFFPQIQPDVVILDDGHQHLKIARDLNILLFDALVPLKNYQTPPLGKLREGLSAIQDADIIIITRANLVEKEKLESLIGFLKFQTEKYRHHDLTSVESSPLILQAGYKMTGIFNISGQKVKEINQLNGEKVILLAGLASPQSFFQSVESLGAEIIDKFIFPDHYYFNASEIQSIIQKAKLHQARILTTEKDLERIRRVYFDEQILFLGIEFELLIGEDLFKQKILNIVGKK